MFVLGHWRTGTTLLHELLIQDPAHASPTTLHCFLPNHFLLTEDFFKKYLWFLVPEKRPMDNMAMGWDEPQEDEFALALLGRPSPYTDVAFPNRMPIDPGSLDLSGLNRRELAAWKRTFRRFLQAVQVRFPDQRLVLKSPPHTARVRVLLELFPDAKFVHIRRDPYVLFASTVNLWRTMAKKQGLQTPKRDDLIREKVFREFRTIYERYFADRELHPGRQPGRSAVRGVGRRSGRRGRSAVYAGLGLPGSRPSGRGWKRSPRPGTGTSGTSGTQSPEERAEIREQWGDLIDALGYGEPPVTPR